MRKPENGGDASPVKEIIAQISGLVKTLDYSSLTNNVRKSLKNKDLGLDIIGRVFVSVYGKMVDNCTVNRAVSSALSRLEGQGKPIGHITTHALRDTFATRYIEQGGSPQTLKTILGHSSLSMTMDLYSHVLPNTKQKEMDNLKIVL